MSNRQFFVCLLALVYFLVSLALLFVPLWFLGQQGPLASQYADLPLHGFFSTILILIIILHAGILSSLILICLRKARTGLWMLVVFGGIWLALQLTHVEGVGFLRPVAEMLILILCVLSFANRKNDPAQQTHAPEFIEDEQ
jgi:hypothetical protein